MALHNILGKEGELLATEFLIKRGYTIRETNWKLNHLEIDIIAQEKGNVLHIVEVKTRADDEAFDPLDAITSKKISHMVAAANAYVNMTGLDYDVQFDIMVIVGTSPADFRIEYLPDAFFPPLRSY